MPDIINSSRSEVIIFDHLKPEAAAMALALYSRDPRSVRVHLEHIERVGPEKFMGTYYVNYGHKSIGDCGSTTICHENGSMLNAKAIQNNRLYNGQEASTRYLDMGAQAVLNPLGTGHGRGIQERWMLLYSVALEKLRPHLIEKYPSLETDDPKQYLKAINARAFDIARSFLPAGATTYVGWHSNLRQAWDHIKEMSFNPLAEVRQAAQDMLINLQEKYPNSFSFKSYEEQDVFYARCGDLEYEYVQYDVPFDFKDSFDTVRLYHPNNHKHLDLLKTRPVKTELPDWFDRYGSLQYYFHLDFGSWRDMQRQRSCVQIMPLLTTYIGFHPWYLENLTDELRQLAEETIELQENEIRKIEDPLVRQYYIAMGYQVGCEITAGLPSSVYIAELRSGQAVHPTLRPVAQKMADALKTTVPDIALHCDMSPDEWSTLRGKHDIIKK
ncbi:MAG: FAD-dependent thymidylate synthase [Minisyncoccota bacterium]